MNKTFDFKRRVLRLRAASGACATTLLFFGAQRASAHVGYVLPQDEFAVRSGADWQFIAEPFLHLENVMLMIGTVVVATVLYALINRLSLVQSKTRRIKEKTAEYAALIPWMLRLSLGIAMIGAGTARALVAPSLAAQDMLAFLEVFTGFLLLIGFMLPAATGAAIGLFVLAFSQSSYLFGNIDLFAVALALLVLADPKPGIDDLLGIPFLSPMRKLKTYVPLILRIGVGGAMAYLAIYEKFLNPHLSAQVVEQYGLQNVVPVSSAMWVLSAGAIELLVGLFLIFGVRTRLTAAVAFAVLSLSFFYFGEGVYSHITLFGALSVLFVTGGGVYSFDERKLHAR